GNVTFAVAATGAGPLAFQWRKGGVAIPGATTATLAIASVQSADAGNYDVVVSNAFGTAVSNTATLSVVEASVPVITQQPQSVTVKVNRNATFSVSVSSTSPVTYQWFKDNTSISGATSSTLKLTKVKSSDAGIYHVRISNASGSAISDDAVLTVQ
ncbi:MAG TPA: immunoglobulin domain-containing protein, partial [Opitutaceae bacterium]|nr:immunoglobulin domain-containing protein [Opitutaceae bacterium]